MMFHALSDELLKQAETIRGVTSAAVATGHDTYVHHVAIDPLDQLLATCSGDKAVRIFSRERTRRSGNVSQPSPLHADASDSSDDDAEGAVGSGDDASGQPSRHQWALRWTLREHAGAVLRLHWVRSEQGVHLASSGVDGRVTVYRVASAARESIVAAAVICQVDGGELGTAFDVAFCHPKSWGPDTLLFAATFQDGSVRPYFFDSTRVANAKYKAAFPWEDLRAARRLHSGASPAVPVDTVRTLVLAECEIFSASQRAATSASTKGLWEQGSAAFIDGLCPQGSTAVSWCPSAWSREGTPPMLAVGTTEGLVAFYYLNRLERRLCRSTTSFSHPLAPQKRPFLGLSGSVTCVAWAPRLGRDYELVAVGSRSSTAILRVTRLPSSSSIASSSVPCLEVEVTLLPTSCTNAQWDVTATQLLLSSESSPSPQRPRVGVEGGAAGEGGAATVDHYGSIRLYQQEDACDHQSWSLLSALW